MDHDDQAREVRQRMAALRRDLAGDVESVSQSARALADWRYYVERFPYAAAGLAAAVGFLVVPKRSKVVTHDPETLAALAKVNQAWLKAGGPPTSEKSRGVLGGLLAIAASGASRLAMNWAREQLKASLANGFRSREEPEEEEMDEPVSRSNHLPPR